ncbi:zinc metalloproteinase nas-36-like [Mytilus edulis]|uniref:zinc metalloproteinase nas-36-like n=1 Tax=Mytilus edulis TaxID=6550 RepID=UPI0039EF2828
MPIKYRVKRGLSSTLVKKATTVWEKNTCIRFKKKKFIIPGPNLVFRKVKQNKCSSKVGRKPIFQYINLGPSCLHVGIVVHEIGHALGFWHEQSRPDRNSYIKVIKKNIKKKKYHNFVRYPWSQSRIFGLPYDYSSIMHYGSHAFSVSSGSKQTIIPRQDDYDRTIGQRQVLSFYDAKAANFHYCESKCSGGLTWFKCKNGGYKNPNKCNECKCPDGLRGRYCTIPAKSLPNSGSCGDVTLSAKSSYKSFTSPGYSGSGYSTSNECSWFIKAPKGKRVQFQFRNLFKISCRRNCRDYVEVRYKKLSDAGPRYCCYRRPTRTYKSSTRYMLINFRTFSGQRKKGFSARYKYI